MCNRIQNLIEVFENHKIETVLKSIFNTETETKLIYNIS